MKQNDCILICNRFVWERNRSVDIFPPFPFRRERNRTIAYRSTFHISFLVVPFVGRDSSIEAFPSERNPSEFHFSEQNGRSGTIAFPCERYFALYILPNGFILRVKAFFQRFRLPKDF